MFAGYGRVNLSEDLNYDSYWNRKIVKTQTMQKSSKNNLHQTDFITMRRAVYIYIIIYL